MLCEFVQELRKLRKLSMESVENTTSFDMFKQYMHVRRPVEDELRDMLVHVNSTNHKALILLCGSAGDGKSHLLSYLGNADSEHLLNSFELYNDATESSAPSLTSIDTLAVKLSAFDDQHILEDDGSRMVLAINLGTLNNFIESEKGENFSLLKKYVEENEIFSSYVRPNAYQEGSVFQHVSFSDYQIFTLCEDGVRTTYLEELLNKIFDQSQGNPFFKAYQTNSTCTLCQKCPLRHNFEFLFNPVHRKGIINKIVEVVIKDKAIVSTRDVLNLVYDLLVHPEFSYETFCHVGTSETQYLTEYRKRIVNVINRECLSAAVLRCQKHIQIIAPIRDILLYRLEHDSQAIAVIDFFSRCVKAGGCARDCNRNRRLLRERHPLLVGLLQGQGN